MENNSNLKTLFFMLCEPKGQELNTVLVKKNVIFDLKKISVWSGCVHLIWQIYAKKRNSQGHFEYIKKHKIKDQSSVSWYLSSSLGHLHSYRCNFSIMAKKFYLKWPFFILLFCNLIWKNLKNSSCDKLF